MCGPECAGISAGGSRFETWFAMKMQAVFGGTQLAAGDLHANTRKKISGAHDDLRDVVERQNIAA